MKRDMEADRQLCYAVQCTFEDKSIIDLVGPVTAMCASHCAYIALDYIDRVKAAEDRIAELEAELMGEVNPRMTSVEEYFINISEDEFFEALERAGIQYERLDKKGEYV